MKLSKDYTKNSASLHDVERRLKGLSLDQLKQEALDEMHAAGLPFEEIIPNASWQRHPKQDAMWYVADTGSGKSGLPYLMVAAGDARITGGVDKATLVYKSWQHNGRTVSQDDAKKIAQDIEAAALQRKKQLAKDRAAAAEKAQTTWDSASPTVNGHMYLQRKRVGAYGIKLLDQCLLIPVADVHGKILGLQTITPDGDKRFNLGAAVSGHFHLLGKIGERLYVTEGYATAATIHKATGQAVACCFNAGNLKPVAEQLRNEHPRIPMVICADNDQWTKGNPGRSHASEAAISIGAELKMPMFKDVSTKPTDFNDLHCLEGMDAVKKHLVSAQDAIADDDWPEPIPLPTGLAPVKDFSFDLLPDALRPWAQDICDRMQCPPDYVGVSAMVALSGVMGRKIAIRPKAKDNWTVVANLWAIIVGRPGVLKSPAMEAALQPLKALTEKANEEARQVQIEYEREATAAKLRHDAAIGEAKRKLAKDREADLADLLEFQEIEEPTLRRYIVNDTTSAALGELMRQNPNGLLVHRDEIVSLLRSLDREDSAEARGFYLTGWNGDSSYTFDRIGRGMNLSIPAVCLSLLGSTQPARVAQYLRSAVQGGALDDGLIQRFGMLVWPDIGGPWSDVDRRPDADAKRAAFDAFYYVDGLDVSKVGAVQDSGHDSEPEGVPYLRFDDEGQKLFRGWRTDLEARLRSDDLHPALESHLAKYRKLVPGLALLLHVADKGIGPVPYKAVQQALNWAEYLESHAERAYKAVTAPQVDSAKAILSRIKRGDLPRTFSSRDVWRPGWAKLNDRQTVLDALQLLEEFYWLTTRKRETAGRTATDYVVNPRGQKT